MKVTAFGKMLRKLRIDLDINLKQMADTLKVTSSHISAIELGKKNVPMTLIEKIATVYRLDVQYTMELRRAAAISATTVKIDLKDNTTHERDLVHAFARSYRNLDPETQQKLKLLLED